jgi:hypothetical protein
LDLAETALGRSAEPVREASEQGVPSAEVLGELTGLIRAKLSGARLA